ncbi:MAG: alpha/beta fold hydrolase, partial [Devosia sp.]
MVTGNARSAATASGDGAPLLLLPGTVCDARIFGPMLAHLPPLDVRIGDMTGASTTPDLARRLLDAAPERFSLLGFSLGGIVALEMAAQAPGRIARLALIDTTARPDPPENAARRRNAVAEARMNGMERYIHSAWPTLVARDSLDNATLHAVISAMARDAGAEVLATQSEVAIHRADSRQRLAALAMPTLVLAGAEEQVCPLAAQRELVEGITDAHYALIPGA